MAGPAIKVEGLRELRAALRLADREALKEVQQGLKHAAESVAEEARGLAPRRTGALAGSYRAFTRGNVAGVASTLPYAPVIEYGGTIRPKGTAILIRRSLPVTRAVERQSDRIVEQVADGIDRALDRAAN